MAAKIVHIPKGASTDADVIEKAPPKQAGPPIKPLTGANVAALVPEVGWARLVADDDPRLSLLCELGDPFPTITQGYGGWDTVDRPHNTGITTWRGFQPIGVDLPLMIDDLDDGHSVETAIDILEALAGRGKLRTGGKPPTVIVHTAGVMPHDAYVFPDARWVITNLDWDEEQIVRNDAGNRVRAPVAVSLLQYTTDSRLQERSFALREQLQARQQNRKGARVKYTVLQGETLVSIARKKLGDPGRWPEIARLNPQIRDPRAVHAGAVIRIPFK